MAGYVQVRGVRTWYEERGEGLPLVLLHGGMGDALDFAANIDALAARFRVFVPERRGHGHTADVDGPITYELMAEDTIAFLDDVVGGSAHLVGHSDGANVALLVARRRPDLARRVVSISGNFHHDGLIPGAIDADAADESVGAAYGEVSPDGREHLPVVTRKLARMWAEEPTLTPLDLSHITTPTLVMVGDDDAITLEHTVALYRGLPNSELAVVPGTSHLLVMEKPTLCNKLIVDFLTAGAVPTLLPIRRRT
jgi:pimeloyl-ACP methyl ester carboxylesterase